MKKFLSEYPELIKEWHPTKNWKLKPEEFTYGSKKKVWWLCPNGHEYDSVINKRTKKEKQQGCPYCSGRRVSEDNNLLSLFPKVATEWHPTKNGSSRPEEFASRSHKKVWWLCPNRHEYDSLISNRTREKPTGCPYCSGQKVSEDNNLLSLFPKVASEWHPTKNGKLKPEEFAHGSGQKVWWLCPKGHSYDAVIYNRTGKNKTGCPFCSGREATEENNLKHIFPKVAAEWHPTKNGDSRPEDFTPKSSSKKAWWLCQKGHSYDATIGHRTDKNPTGCPYCSGRRVSKENNLKHSFPKIASEWHPTKNGDLKPEEFTKGSGKKVWWLCPKGHDYDAVIYSRTTNKPNGCPHCYRNVS